MDIVRNKNGGVEQRDKLALKRAKENDLISFPPPLTGTNCYNCQWIRDKKNGIGYCFNKRIEQFVNAHMCCNLWNKEGTVRAWEHKD